MTHPNVFLPNPGFPFNFRKCSSCYGVLIVLGDYIWVDLSADLLWGFRKVESSFYGNI